MGVDLRIIGKQDRLLFPGDYLFLFLQNLFLSILEMFFIFPIISKSQTIVFENLIESLNWTENKIHKF